MKLSCHEEWKCMFKGNEITDFEEKLRLVKGTYLQNILMTHTQKVNRFKRRNNGII